MKKNERMNYKVHEEDKKNKFRAFNDNDIRTELEVETHLLILYWSRVHWPTPSNK